MATATAVPRWNAAIRSVLPNPNRPLPCYRGRRFLNNRGSAICGSPRPFPGRPESRRVWGNVSQASPAQGRKSCRVRAQAAEKETYQGVYGTWSVEDSDTAEVLLYRAGLNVGSFSLLAASLPALFPSLSPPLPLDTLFWTGGLSLGLSLTLIHIYVTPIKRTLQALWAAGFLGALVLSSSALGNGDEASSSLVQYVVDHPIGIWAVGPLFAALTGLVFKEGLCYGKLEAALLVLVIPSLLLGHLSGILSPDVERTLLGTWVVLSLIFALRKFTQPIKDDIGDKSVFVFQALPREEQEEVLRSMKAQ